MNAPGAVEAAGFRPAVVRAGAAVDELRRTIAAQHAAGGAGFQTCGLATERFDAIVREVWEAILADLPQADPLRRRVAVVAHGGFGRRQMAPWSDIDLMLLHADADPDAVAAVARRLVQDLFDAGLQVGQSVRGVAEACRLAAGDATILSTLLDCRTLAGPDGLRERLAARLAAAVRRAPRRHAEMLLAARREEADKFGQTVALLEPNVKRSPGGLRDTQLVGWLGRVLHGAESLDDLALAGGLSRADADTVRDATEFLLRVRNDLHLAAGKAADDLTRDQQLRIAAARGIESSAGLLGVERFMREYFAHTRGVARVVESLAVTIRRPHAVRSWAAAALGHRVDGLFRVGPGDVAVLPGGMAAVAGSTAAIIRLVELAMLYDLPIEPATWEAVREAAPALPREPDQAAIDAFLALFAHPEGLAAALRRLHEIGVLEILVPGFVHARHLLQFNNYHKFTVDEHSILAVERVVGFGREEGWLGSTWRELNRKRPLLLAVLMHDLGKGFVEDHSEVGARLAREAASRLGLPADEAEIVEFLVLKHLAMAHLAFRRDVGDDSIVVRFACEVGSPEVLRMLALLTAADVAAVGPGTWTKWKADLLGDLHFRTLGHLDGEGPAGAVDRGRRRLEELLADRPGDDPVRRIAALLPSSYLRETPPAQAVEELGRLARLAPDGAFALARWQPETSTVAVSVGTRESVAPGVFHRVTGALTSQRLEILAAGIHTLDDGLVIDHFTVHDPDFSGPPPPERLADIAAAIRAALKADRPPEFARRWNPFAPQAAAVRFPTRVLFDNESSRTDTILEVFAHDAPGLLYGIARVLFDAGLSVKAAKIGTHLDQVVDAFHVVDAAGGKLTDPDRMAQVRRAIEAVVAPVTGPA
jgi:[protein-PII] uridylyltransferase